MSQSWDTAIESGMALAGIPGLAALVVGGGETILSRGYGVLRRGEGAQVTPDTLFQIGSLAKAVTATSVATLVGEGVINWDDPVRKHLPDFRLADEWVSSHMTIRDILALRSGIESGDSIALFSDNTRPEIIEAAADLEATHFRQTYALSPNLMYFLAGEIVATASGQSWDEFVRQRFFRPLGMHQTVSVLAEGERHDDFAWPHDRENDETVPRANRAQADNVAAAAGIMSNVTDWAKWVQLHLQDGVWEGQPLVAPNALAETRSPQILLTPAYQGFFNPHALLNAYGFGWVVSEHRGRTLLEHGGALPGYGSIIALLPEKGIGVVMMSNLDFLAAAPTLLRLKFEVINDLLDWTAQ